MDFVGGESAASISKSADTLFRIIAKSAAAKKRLKGRVLYFVYADALARVRHIYSVPAHQCMRTVDTNGYTATGQ